MSAQFRLAAMMACALLLASVATHVVVAALGIPTTAGNGYKRFGNPGGANRGVIFGSSLTYDALNWTQVADSVALTIESWPVPGSSPCEWEQLRGRSAGARMAFVGVSLYDLNEGWLCDFRADIVPLRQTLMDLWESGSDLTFARRVSSAYPRASVRSLFPTAGRSERVLAGLRDHARDLLGQNNGEDDREAALRLAADYTSEVRISDWPRDRLLRRLAAMRGAQGKHTFSGPKHLALARLLREAHREGTVVVAVLPVSPPYRANLVGRAEIQQFAASLSEIRQRVPEAKWVRLDQLPSLDSADYFYDLVHLNMQGRRIATAALLQSLAETAPPR